MVIFIIQDWVTISQSDHNQEILLKHTDVLQKGFIELVSNV